MNSEKIPLRTHVSAETMRLNPALYPAFRPTSTSEGHTGGEGKRCISEPNPPPKGWKWDPDHEGNLIPDTAKPKPSHRKLEQKARQPNKTEARFGAVLEGRKKRGEIDSYRYEGMSLRWGGGMRYTADWVVIIGTEVYLLEVKGKLLRNQDLVRFKGCKSEWPEFHFEMHQEVNREWKRVL